MKKGLLLGALLISTASLFTSCKDDNDSNPSLIQPTEFKLNDPAYINETVDLKSTTELVLNWTQPKYTADNAPIQVTYELQISPSNSFTVSTTEAEADKSKKLVADYANIARTTTLCQYTLQAEDLNKALLKVGNWKEDAVPAEQDAYIRINAYILENGVKHGAVVSNSIKLSTTPYYVLLKDADPILWYLVGNNIADGSWGSEPGKTCIPMMIQPDYAYDKTTGEGEITYLNYFTMDAWKIQRSDFNWDYGFMGDGTNANTAVYRNGEGDKGNIWVDPAGYYLVTVNTKTIECTIKKQDITPTVYEQICVAGSFTGDDWPDANMTPANKSGENHVWYYIVTVEKGKTEQFKFKIPELWSTNWGFGSEDGEINTRGTAFTNGKNIGIEEGKWIISFNDITGEFNITALKD